MKTTIIRYFIHRLTEASTIKGIVLFVSSMIGQQLTGDQTDSVVWIVLGFVGLLGTFLPDIITVPKFETDAEIDSQPSGNDVDSEYITIPKPKYKEGPDVPTPAGPISGWGDK